jgi:hypothetical protein
MRTLLLILLPFIGFAQGDYEKTRSNYAKAQRLGLTGKGVKIAILDRGATRVGTRGVTETWVDFTYGYDFVDDDTVVTHDSDHGNFVLTPIKSSHGLAPDATVYVLKVSDAGGTISMPAAIDALQYCIDNDIDIINISYQFDQTANSKIADCIAAGIVVVAAAGNDPCCGHWTDVPATLPDVIAVNAIDSDGAATLFSVTPAEDVTNSHGITIAASGADCYVIGRAGVLTTSNGTSFSAPWIVGCFAIYKERYPTMSNHAVMQLILDRAIKQPNTTYFGAGRPTF